MHYKRVRVAGGTYFFTVVMYRRREVFASGAAVDLFDEAVAQVRAMRPFAVEARVILPDHLHTMWSMPDDDADYSTRWRLIKERFTRAYLKRFNEGDRSKVRDARRERAVWQRRFWEHLIRDERDFQAHADYIHINPVRHGLVDRPGDWPYSTFQEWVERGIYEPNWGTEEKPVLPDWVGKE